MAVKNPIGIDGNGNLYEMDATDLATKNPICLYSGELKELQSGDTLPAGGGTDPVVREYIANDTWTKPTASNFVGIFVAAACGTGGGGSGRRGAPNTNRCGGSGSPGATMVRVFIPASQITLSSYSVTIGAGGIGGAPVTVDNTNGNNGGSGSGTYLGTAGSELAMVGRTITNGGGRGGTNATSTGANSPANIANNVPRYGPFGLRGNNGASGSAGFSGGAGIIGFGVTTSGTNGNASGGGGGGLGTDNLERDGGNGGGCYYLLTTAGAPLGGTVAGVRDGSNGIDDFNVGLHFDGTVPTTYGAGTGGAGGASGDAAGTVAGGNGGNAGRLAGAGGGGGSTNGANSGAGGNGSNGYMVIVEYYGA